MSLTITTVEALVPGCGFHKDTLTLTNGLSDNLWGYFAFEPPCVGYRSVVTVHFFFPHGIKTSLNQSIVLDTFAL